MKKVSTFLLMLVVLTTAFQVLASEPANYYNNASGKQDEALMTALRNIIRNHTQLSYNALWNAFISTDTDADGYIIDMYSNCKYRPEQHGGSASTVGEGYNREHSFPKSWFNNGDPMYTDLFHLYPTDIRVNNQRDNYPFGVCADGTRLVNGQYYGKGKLGRSTYPGYSGNVFEPDDEYKGDFARTYFYMVTCYKNELPSWSGSPQLDYNTNRYKAFSTWSINMLMEWSRLDPVSEKEIKRNDAVYGIQGNRNPFIDHPELAEYIWGDMQGQSWNGSGEQITATITSPADGSIFDMGTVTVGDIKEYTINIKGEGLTTSLNLSMEENELFYINKNTFTASEVNSGTSFVIGFASDDVGAYSNQITLSSSEVSSTFTVNITVNDNGDTPDPPIALGDSIMEDWEGCTTGGYWNNTVEGHAWTWEFINAGIWNDNFSHGQLSCRLGKSSTSSITMAEDVEGGTSAISLWATCFGNDGNADLRVDYSTNHGATWAELGDFTVTRGIMQYFIMEIPMEGSVRFRIVQTSGTRVNIDDITIFAPASQHLVGDVNEDGEVNITDVNAIVDIILGGTVNDNIMNNADISGDNEVNITDINALLDIIMSN